MEVKTTIFKRVPPGDRWQYYDEPTGLATRIFTSLTEALEHHFQKTSAKKYFIDAGAGLVYAISEEKDPEPVIQSFSIYGDY